MIGVFNTKDDSDEFLDKDQLPALGIHHVTIHHTHWKYLTSIFLYNNTLTVAMQVQSSTHHFINKLLQLKSSREDLVLFPVICKTKASSSRFLYSQASALFINRL